MEPISLSMAGLILVSMAAGAALSNFFGKKKSCAAGASDESAQVSVDEDKEKAINDLVSGKK
ncbi:MAG: hypothetical protein HQL16_05840 [Candidatus Omnitrophica bacterium]|nr:hypothetical protein [Candidatus Omnitrophota bacterium]